MCNNKQEFDQLVGKYRELTADKKKLEAKLDALKEDMKEYITHKGKKKSEDSDVLVVFGEDYKASLIPVLNPRWDDDKLKAHFGDKYEEYKTPHPYDRIDVR